MPLLPECASSSGIRVLPEAAIARPGSGPPLPCRPGTGLGLEALSGCGGLSLVAPAPKSTCRKLPAAGWLPRIVLLLVSPAPAPRTGRGLEAAGLAVSLAALSSRAREGTRSTADVRCRMRGDAGATCCCCCWWRCNAGEGIPAGCRPASTAATASAAAAAVCWAARWR